MKLIIDIPEGAYKYGTLGLYFDCYSMRLHDTILNGTPIPDNATNGEVLKIMFPNIENQMIDLVMRCGTSVKRIGNDTWMNLTYQKGGKE